MLTLASIRVLSKIAPILTFFPVLLLSFVLLTTSCSDDKKGAREEGVIEFDTKAVDETHPLYGFAPSSATLKFKGKKFVIEMSTMGMFNIAIIADSKKKTVAQTVKFMNIKQACIESQKELEQENKDFELKLDETGETKQMIGLNAHKVKATKVKDPGVTFDVWYTTDLGMEDCNSLTPYAPIKGMLLDYRIKKNGLELHFLAKSYKNISVPDLAFEIPATMKIVSREEMAKLFADLQ
jgi:hypothetical protein